jgi:hypothetical protein
MRVLAIVPAFNESATVGDVVTALRARGDVDVVVIDDGSSDDTGVRAAAAGARVLRLPINLGIGAAVQTGYQFARWNDYDVAVQVDADGQHLPSEIDRLLPPLIRGDAELVLGSRFLGTGDYQPSVPRRLGMVVLSSVVSRVTRQRLSDTTSGFRAAGREAIALFAELYPRDYPEVEALVLLRRRDFRVVEVGCRFADRREGRSSITPVRSLYYMVKVLLAIGVGVFRRVPAGARRRGHCPNAGPASRD